MVPGEDIAKKAAGITGEMMNWDSHVKIFRSEFNFFIAACMVLCFGFVLKTVFITQGC